MIFVFEPQALPGGGYDITNTAPFNANAGADIDSNAVGDANIVEPSYMTFTLSEGANVLPGAAMTSAITAGGVMPFAGVTRLPATLPLGVTGSFSATATPALRTGSAMTSVPKPTNATPSTTSNMNDSSTATNPATNDQDSHKASSSSSESNTSTGTFNKATLIIVFVLLGIGLSAVGWWYARRRRTRRTMRAGVEDLEHSVEQRLSLPRGGLTGHGRRSWVKLDDPSDEHEHEHDAKQDHDIKKDRDYADEKAAMYTVEQSTIEQQSTATNTTQGYNNNNNNPKTFSIYPKHPPPGTEMAYDAQPHPYQRSHSPQQVYQIDTSMSTNTHTHQGPTDSISYGHSYASAAPAAEYQQQNLSQGGQETGSGAGSDYNNVTRESMISNGSSERRKSTISWFPPPPTSLPPLPPLPTSALSAPESQLQQAHPVTVTNAYTSAGANRKSVGQSGIEIGVATTTSVPASSSRSAVAVDSYPVRSATGSGKDLTKLGSEPSMPMPTAKGVAVSTSASFGKRQSLPYVLPVQEAERTPTFLSLSTMPSLDEQSRDEMPDRAEQGSEKEREKRHPTESLYVIYKDK
ncbi:hypothetical protein I317_02275 [Kwoniella heveanensis CBS 569]|nr:hypothetical protein I317_02275 [Kwoniella heveanensis CBS 569]